MGTDSSFTFLSVLIYAQQCTHMTMLLYLMHLSHEPNLELNVPPPNCCASFVTAVRTQVSHALAISLIEWDSGRFLRARENAAC
jgi:hypothetical protein